MTVTLIYSTVGTEEVIILVAINIPYIYTCNRPASLYWQNVSAKKKNSGHPKIAVIWTVWVCTENDADRMENRVEPDKTAASGAVWPALFVQTCLSEYLGLLRYLRNYKDKWAASWQNQQNDCVPSEDSDQPGHPPSLIRVFAVRSTLRWVHGNFFSLVMRRRKCYHKVLVKHIKFCTQIFYVCNKG